MDISGSKELWPVLNNFSLFGVHLYTFIFILFKWASDSEFVGSNPHSLTLFPCYFASPFSTKFVGLIPRPRILFFSLFRLPSRVLGGHWFESHASHLLVYLIFVLLPIGCEFDSPQPHFPYFFAKTRARIEFPPAPIFLFLCLKKTIAKGFDSPLILHFFLSLFSLLNM